jgi:peroxiredoxin
VIGISVDSSESNRAWAEKIKLPFRLLSDVDPTGKVGRQFGVWDATWGLDGRATFVIDKKRTVRFVDAKSLALDPSRTLAAVKRLARPG